MTAVTPQATPLDLAPELSTADLALVLFCLIDDLYRQVVPDTVRLRPGHHRQKLSDAEVITLSVLQEARSNDSETSFIRQIRRDYPELFPGLLSTSRYHRRRKALVGVQQALFAHLADEYARVAGWLAVDSAPVETTKVVRSQTGQKSIPEAAYHFGSCGRDLFFGFRLHTTVTDAGAIVEFALAPANEGERSVAEGMLAAVPPAATGVVLGDNNYCGELLATVAAPYGHAVETSPRKTDTDRASRLWVRSPRVIVETVFGMLADQSNAETTRARSLLGVWSRMVAKVLAFDLSLYVNALLGRPILSVKSLYA
ncbi:IS982 family transposase [Rubrivirga sp.]|uniref:IS982 family transposase n=1 Tax=Rubrivirga sp. TaxID=1885344 RepID=UPI003B5179CE